MVQTKINEMNKEEKYSVEIIRYTIPNNDRISFENAYKEAGIYLKASPYCLGYNILHGDDEPNHYIVTIYWTSKDDHLNGFRKSQQFPSFLNLVRPYYNNIDEMKHYKDTSITWHKDH